MQFINNKLYELLTNSEKRNIVYFDRNIPSAFFSAHVISRRFISSELHDVSQISNLSSYQSNVLDVKYNAIVFIDLPIYYKKVLKFIQKHPLLKFIFLMTDEFTSLRIKHETEGKLSNIYIQEVNPKDLTLYVFKQLYPDQPIPYYVEHADTKSPNDIVNNIDHQIVLSLPRDHTTINSRYSDQYKIGLDIDRTTFKNNDYYSYISRRFINHSNIKIDGHITVMLFNIDYDFHDYTHEVIMAKIEESIKKSLDAIFLFDYIGDIVYITVYILSQKFQESLIKSFKDKDYFFGSRQKLHGRLHKTDFVKTFN